MSLNIRIHREINGEMWFWGEVNSNFKGGTKNGGRSLCILMLQTKEINQISLPQLNLMGKVEKTIAITC